MNENTTPNSLESSSGRESLEHVNNAEVIKHLTAGNAVIEGGESTYVTEGGAICTIDLSSVNVKYAGEKISMLGAIIMDGIYSLYMKRRDKETEKVLFTPLSVYQEITKDYKRKPSPDKLAKIHNEIEKLRETKVTLITTDEYRKKNLIGDYQIKLIDGNAIVATRVVLAHISNGKEYEAYLLEKPMILYSYAEETNNIVLYPTSLLQIYSPTEYTDDAIFVNRYIAREMASAKEDSFDIIYEGPNGMFTEFGYTKETIQDWKAKKKNLRRIVNNILTEMKEAGVIFGFEEFRNENSTSRREPYIGVRITKKTTAEE